MSVSKSHSSLYKILHDAELSGKLLSKEDVLNATQWKEITFDTYWHKGQLSDFLTQIDDKTYQASAVSKLTEIELSKRLSQSKHRRGLGHNFESRLAKALLRKSRDNMMLALELYNRPSLENRLDGFALLFCIAWEQLLKAELIQRDGEKSIYRKLAKNVRVQETISLQECLDRIFQSNDRQRKNLERIIYYRNTATHLLMPEVQGVVSRLFQAGVLNYVGRFEEITEQRFLETNATGLLTLVGELRTPTIASLRSNYGQELGNDILNLVRTLEDEIRDENDWQFAVPIDISVVFARKDKDNALELIASTDEGIEGLRKAIIVEKPIDRKQTHPWKFKDLINEINIRLSERYDNSVLVRHLVAESKQENQLQVNQRCVIALLHKLKWKNADNEFHYASTNPE